MSLDNMKRIVKEKGLAGLLEKEKEVEEQSPEKGLMASAGKNIYCLDEKGKKWLLAQCKRDVNALATYDGRLFYTFSAYHNSDKKYHSTIVDATYKKIIARRIGTTWSLLDHNKVLCDSGYYKKVYDSHSGEWIIRKSPESRSMISQDGNLYCGTKKGVFSTEKNNIIHKSSDWVEDMVWHNGTLYYLSDDKLNADGVLIPTPYDLNYLASHEEELYGSSREGVHILLNDKPVARRSLPPRALLSHQGKLYDAVGSTNQGAIHDTLNDPDGKNPLWTFNTGSLHLIGVDIEVWEKLAKRGKKRYRY